MSGPRNYQIIQPPRSLRDRTGPPVSGLNPMANAEAALQKIQAEADFPSMIVAEMAKLATAVEGLAADAADRDQRLHAIFELVHDLRGQGTSFGYPLVTRIGASLCSYLDGHPRHSAAEVDIVRAHVDALRAVIANKLKGDGGPIGQKVAAELEALTTGG
jgi:hypothetical protein